MKRPLRYVQKVTENGEVNVRMKELRDGDVFFLDEDGRRLGCFRAVGRPYRVPLERRGPELSLQDLISLKYIWSINAVSIDAAEYLAPL